MLTNFEVITIYSDS